VVRAESIPIADDAHFVADGRTPLDHALTDGEDFELLFAVPPEDGKRLIAQQPVAGLTLVEVGEFVAEGIWLEQAGKRMELGSGGWAHSLE
jgi:thiamine-monophosphate kinase